MQKTSIGREVDLLANYPKVNRNLSKRVAMKSEDDRAIAREFGETFFDGDRRFGYGGFNYDPKYWAPVVPAFKEFYNLTEESSLLDVGAAKGFMLHDFHEMLPKMRIAGIDISEYAITHAKDTVKKHMAVANAIDLPFEDNSFDLVISINTLHNLEGDDLIKGLLEVERVSRKHSFIVVDAYRTDEERELLHAWNLTAKSILHVDEWKALFAEIGFTGDHYWFVP
ncbi:MAG: hypothetical protein SP1CHLAM54_15370 [Chlamydiia bacterium]|nr:hypothetical protein [Chlamydiia bacterium]MCH9616427.1 hypothetical protein [Chlamydiia bacterium]MCH9629587.1 hypothetical protein [Chlamydiia bacterium]